MKNIIILLFAFLLSCNYADDINNEVLPPESFFAINDWAAQRAYPYSALTE